MRVVDVTQWYGPTSGGIRTYLRAKAAWAERHGRAHGAVVTGAAEGAELVAGSGFARVRGRTPAARWGYRVAPRPGPVLAALDALAPDVVVLHDAFAFPRAVARWARRSGATVVMLCHSDLRLAATALPRGLRAPAVAALGWAQRRALRVPAALMVASADTRARVGAMASGRVVVTPLGVDLEPFAGARPDPALRARLAPDGPLVVYAGRLSGEKRVDLLAPMLARLGPRARLAVAGAGPARGALVRAARRHGVAGRLTLLGHVPGRRDLARLMASADCFVHPNPDEPYGLAPLEALAAGTRVVAPAAGGCAETLRGRGAVLVAPGDPAALAAGVRLALRMPPPVPDLADLDWDRAFAREWSLYAEVRG